MGLCVKSLIALFIFIMFTYPAFSYGYDSNQNIALQNLFSEYMQDVHKQIDKNWTSPDLLEQAHVTLKFKVNRDGEVFDVEIITSSGNDVYDESAKEALQKSSPFAKFPVTTTRNYITIKYNFDTFLVNTEKMKEYVEKADSLYNHNNELALKYINLAINEIDGDIRAYFLYGKRSKIKFALGDEKGAEEDFVKCQNLKNKYDQKRIIHCKIIAEAEKSPFAYFYLANAYDIAGDYDSAITAIDKAISLTNLNNQYKQYKKELLLKTSAEKI